MTVAAILLAAEATPRLGGPAALLPWGDETLVEYQIGQIREAGVDVIEVVLGVEAERVVPLVAADNVEPVVLPVRAAGMAGALRTGATAVPRDTSVAIVVDVRQPRPAEVYRRLLTLHREGTAEVTRPAFRGVVGAPAVVSAAVLAELRNVTDDHAGIEWVLRKHAWPAATVDYDTDVVLLTIASHEEYERALVAFGLA